MENIVKMDRRKADGVIRTDRLGKTYSNGTVALSDVTLSIDNNDFIAIIGSSGAGKSTFLRCLNQLIQPTCGKIYLQGEDITRSSSARLNNVRRRMGMIFQQFHLVRRLSVIENVLVGRLRFSGSPVNYGMSLFRCFPKIEKEIAFDCLKQVGIERLAFQRADTLSGGQQQRVAIARALAQEPEVFLADEPIASLDPRSAEIVMETLREIHERRHIPVLVNLHHIHFAKDYGKRIIGMKQGQLVFDTNREGLSREMITHIYDGDAILENMRAAGNC